MASFIDGVFVEDNGSIDHLLPELKRRVSDGITSSDSIRSYLDESRFIITERNYMRFLRGVKGDVDKAEKALLEYLTYRSVKRVEFINFEVDCINEINKKIVTLCNHDKDGTPVFYIIVERHVKDRNLEELEWFILTLVGRAIHDDAKNIGIEKVTVVFDMQNFSIIKNMDYEAVKLIIQILQTHFSETLKHALIVNAPFIFSACYAIIRPWLDPVTAAKVQFVTDKILFEKFVDNESAPSEFVQRTIKKGKVATTSPPDTIFKEGIVVGDKESI